MELSNRKALQKSLRRNGLKTHLRDLLLVTAMGVFIGVVWSSDNDSSTNFKWLAMYSFVLGGTLWKGSEFISIFIYSRFDLLKSPGKLILYNSIGTFAWVLIDVLLVNYFFYILFFDIDIPTYFAKHDGWLMLFVEYSIAVIINLIFFSINFFKSWNFLNKKKAELERDKMALEFQTLRDQVKPHFLFNSLNTLSALVDIDQDRAQLFISELSKVYRYVLDTQKDETILLKDEMQFVDSFVYLNQLRLGDNLVVTKSIEISNQKVVPLAVQMLVENAIKHNVASSDRPLIIDISIENDCILVKNNYQPKQNFTEEKVSKNSRLGLDNLKFRYNFITGKELKIQQEEGSYKVYLPLI